MLDELLCTAEDCSPGGVNLEKLDPQKRVQKKSEDITVYEVPSFMLGDHLAVYLYIYVQIFGYHPRLHAWKWKFIIIVDQQAFTS